MKILNLEQGTQEWHDERRCSITGTKLKAVMGTEDAQRTLIAELIAEEGTELTKEYRTTTEMERGNGEEEFAVKRYEELTGKKVDRIGMCVHDTHEWIKLSPDGLIKNKGKYTEGLEVKCPDSKKLILYKIENEVPLAETGLVTSYTVAEIKEILDKENIEYDSKAKKPELESLLPAGYDGKPKASAPFCGVIPQEYKWQVVHYFIVVEDLKKMYFETYDERFIDENVKTYIVEVERSHPEMKQAIKEAEEQLQAFRNKWMQWKDIVLPSNF